MKMDYLGCHAALTSTPHHYFLVTKTQGVFLLKIEN